MEQVSVEELEKYLEVLYEDNIEKKISFAKQMLMLALDPSNIEFILNHGIPFLFE